jgi:hypothetical protein
MLILVNARSPSAWYKVGLETGHPPRSRIGKGASPRLKRVAMKGLTITATAVCCVLLGASAPRADNSGTQKVDPAFSQAVKVYVECFGNALKSLAADPKDSAESIVTAVQAECEAEHSYARSLLLKSAKDATFSEGFTIGLAMGVLELKRLKCAKSGHSPTAWRTGQIDPRRALPLGALRVRSALACGRSSRKVVARQVDVETRGSVY